MQIVSNFTHKHTHTITVPVWICGKTIKQLEVRILGNSIDNFPFKINSERERDVRGGD